MFQLNLASYQHYNAVEMGLICVSFLQVYVCGICCRVDSSNQSAKKICYRTNNGGAAACAKAWEERGQEALMIAQRPAPDQQRLEHLAHAFGEHIIAAIDIPAVLVPVMELPAAGQYPELQSVRQSVVQGSCSVAESVHQLWYGPSYFASSNSYIRTRKHASHGMFWVSWQCVHALLIGQRPCLLLIASIFGYGRPDQQRDTAGRCRRYGC
jgi:hypothetical protein